ncbi:ATP-binding cassette domain-containing protein [Demequina muriae]|uniref:ATP-binding cassette domain-containing protein n=1 Tax=Demequina muriae TaxID=3051664 RepID=A0ABT8GGQ7_9MICO|nr:ATP-binding cassette domain-containing protein [Demequina sp. EGI L300058]MDN4480456.1 ATP-binding cassette domain-containing protein [Demequina sp. EGI L300058]
MNPLLTVSDLRLRYPRRGLFATSPEVLRGVSLDIAPGETLGLVGESGSGKTTLGRAVLGLAKPTGGSISFDGRDITHETPKARRDLARDIQVVFQDPYSSLNPALQISETLAEPLIAQGETNKDARATVAALLDKVGLPADSAERYPREFSGGQRQRVAIARALALSPRLIVCDEPVSALDLTTQARVLDLLIDIQRETGVAYLFITHDLQVVRHISHRIAVMYQGELVETGKAADVTSNPEHEYTQNLLFASPTADPDTQRERRERRQELRREQAAAST